MRKAEINALETRFKSTFLLLMKCKFDEVEEIKEVIDMAQLCFDKGGFESCKKALDIVDSIIVDILEVSTFNYSLN